ARRPPPRRRGGDGVRAPAPAPAGGPVVGRRLLGWRSSEACEAAARRHGPTEASPEPASTAYRALRAGARRLREAPARLAGGRRFGVIGQEALEAREDG